MTGWNVTAKKYMKYEDSSRRKMARQTVASAGRDTLCIRRKMQGVFYCSAIKNLISMAEKRVYGHFLFIPIA